jgi:aminoglycoside phosphotransferase (APT) family kinase protein
VVDHLDRGEVHVDELRRIGQGREAEIFAWGTGRVLRLARTAALGEELQRERVALHAARRCGAPAPAVYEEIDVDGRAGLVLERLDGHDLLAGLVRRPWQLASLPRVLARVQASLHETVAPAELPDLHAEVAERLQSAHVPRDLRDAGQRALQQLPDGDRLCHGDFHPGNVLRRADGCYVPIDWKAAARGDPAADVARTRLLIVGAWIPGLGSRALQSQLRPFRIALYAAYRAAYAHRRHLERRAVAAWLPVLAAARLSYDIAQERRRLLALARRGLRDR